jgi:hypothetical protein
MSGKCLQGGRGQKTPCFSFLLSGFSKVVTTLSRVCGCQTHPPPHPKVLCLPVQMWCESRVSQEEKTQPLLYLLFPMKLFYSTAFVFYVSKRV